MAASPPDPPSHDETMIESSILEVPPSYSEPALPPRPVRKGPIVASLLLTVFSLAGGSYVLYGRSLDDQEREFVALAQGTLDAGGDPGPALQAARQLPAAVQQRVSVLSLSEQLEARAAELEQRALAGALLAEASQDRDLAARGRRLGRVLERAPGSPRGRALLAHHQLEVWAREGAAPTSAQWEELTRSLAELPAHPSVLVARARIALTWRGRDPGARSAALSSLAEAGEDPSAQHIQGDPSEAAWAGYAQAWRSALAQEPGPAVAALEALPAEAPSPLLGSLLATLRGQLAWTRGDLAAASAELTRARELDPLAEAPAVWAAWVRSEAGDSSGPAPAELVRTWPRSPVARATLAQAEGRQAPRRAASRAEEALALDRGSDLAHLVAARAALARGDLEPAQAHAVKAVLWGRSLAAFLLRVELGLARRDLEFVAQDLRAARALAPTDPRVTLAEGRVELQRGRAPDALRLAQEVLRASPQTLEAHVLAARALGATARWQEAASAVEEAIKLDPSHVDARLARAEVLVQTNQSVLALTDLEQLRDEGGLVATEVAYLSARAHRELGETPRARAAYQRFLQLALRNDPRRRLATRYLSEK